MQLKFWPSGHSADYTVVVETRSDEAAEEYLKRSLPKILKKLDSETREDIESAKIYAEGSKVVIYKEFMFGTPTHFGALRVPGVKLKKHPERYPNQTLEVKFMVPTKSSDSTEVLHSALLLGCPREEADTAKKMMEKGMMERMDPDGIVFKVKGSGSYLSNSFYPDTEDLMSIDLGGVWWKILKQTTDFSSLSE